MRGLSVSSSLVLSQSESFLYFLHPRCRTRGQLLADIDVNESFRVADTLFSNIAESRCDRRFLERERERERERESAFISPRSINA